MRNINIMGVKCKGFSLIEFFIVIAILAILASIGFPSIQKLYRVYKFNQYAFELENTVKWAKITAMERSSNISICLNGNEIRVYDEGTKRSPSCSGNLLRIMKINDTWITPSISVALSQSGLMFDPRGLTIYGGNVCITDGERYFKAVLQSDRGAIGIKSGSGRC
ncbi:pilin [Thermodesulfobacterium geofontis OPF15]|uniref:Pilin n=1 Tax=Thermodesulfobacterium geofontis (strain OPF15) TaxID=795359 RepID=F8C1Q4_THEGP|nr:prepilin-type N-terminal cleavage/methylation domain-containing protein [Thermodesulfobacterium geofontis]AEH22123.1 pilin [Thermodesulfobacterium geofontis OPF15]